MKNEINKSIFGILAEFKHPGDLIKAAKQTNLEGYRKWDTYSPFPVHGMDDAMGLKKSNLGIIVLGHAIMGFLVGLALHIFTSTIYAHNISGKPWINLPSYVPVTFELTVLFAAFGAVFGMFFLNNMPRHYNKLFNSERFKKVTDDGFFIAIEAVDDLFDEKKTTDFLRKVGAINIETIEG